MKASHIRQLAGVDAIKSALTERHKREQGSILFVALILLIILTLLAFTALRTATMQERMAGNARDRAIAFQAAEAALRGAEKYLASNPSPAAATFSGTTCSAKGVYKLVNGVPFFASTGSSFSGTSTKWDGSSQDFVNCTLGKPTIVLFLAPATTLLSYLHRTTGNRVSPPNRHALSSKKCLQTAKALRRTE